MASSKTPPKDPMAERVRQLNDVMKAMEYAGKIESELMQTLSRAEGALSGDERALAAEELNSTIQSRKSLQEQRRKLLKDIAAVN